MKTETRKKTKDHSRINVFEAFCTLLPKIIRVSPWVFVLWQVISIAHGLAYGMMAPVTQIFFDQAAGYAAHKTELLTVILGLIFLGLAHAIKQVLNGVSNFMLMMYYRKAEGALSLGVHEKMSRIAPVCFEDTGILDDMNKALQGKNEAVWFTGTILLMCNFYIPYFAVMAFYLFAIKPLLAVSLALIFTPTLLTQIFRTKVFTRAEDRAAPVRREFDYYESCLTGREYFKETRILGAFSFFRTLYADSLSLLNRLRFRASVKSDLAELGMQLLSLSGYAGILLLLLDSLLKGEISAGAFAAIFGSVDQMFSLMKELICSNLGAVARDFGRVQNYLRFLQMPEREGADAEMPEHADISLQGVSFSYPGAEKKAVDNVTLTIRSGETVALVGENGSGKSTLVRLITGLYLPDAGDVLYEPVTVPALQTAPVFNGGRPDSPRIFNTRNMSAASLFRQTSAVFQKYQRYQMTLGENIGISSVNKPVSETELGKVCIQAGIDQSDRSLSNGCDTMLSREFDGVDLSGGQWQRVAIARSFFRPHRFIVLDEPTAAIDPIEETKIYNRFAEISRDKTALIITHRLGSVKLADRILVMKGGNLVEQGTHAELMALEGEYTRLYRSQEQWYIE
ncbi:ATP-binding cassette subfamily B protein [Anaerotaenia torta]|uniref:ABC transporter ATP-binding protein n=1 Tax=Anaerotaenia torta TaxID=433293 RepID=UPI003D216F8D